jgi:hypothetical protein
MGLNQNALPDPDMVFNNDTAAVVDLCIIVDTDIIADFEPPTFDLVGNREQDTLLNNTSAPYVKHCPVNQVL